MSLREIMPVLCVPKMFKVSPSKHSNFKTVRISGIWNFLDLSELQHKGP